MPILHYHQKTHPWRTRFRPILKWTAIVTVTLVFAWISYTAAQRIIFLRLQLQAIDFAEPPGAIVFSDELKTVARLETSPGYQRVRFNEIVLCNERGQNAMVQSTRAYSTHAAFPSGIRSIYLHRHQNGLGEERILSLECEQGYLSHRLYTPGTWWSAPLGVTHTQSTLHVPRSFTTRTSDLTYFAPQPDLADPGVFHIELQYVPSRGKLTGRLNATDQLEWTTTLGTLSGGGSHTIWILP